MSIPQSLTLQQAAARCWDVAVVGAGPAGAAVATLLARRGLGVLLVDRSPFPRFKVCGGTLNLRALACLERLGLGRLSERLGAVPLRRFVFATGGHQAEVGLPGGVAVSREALDAALVREAVSAGGAFLPGHTAVLGPATAETRSLRLSSRGATEEIHARLILGADGLHGSLRRGFPALRSAVRTGSRIGAGTVLPHTPPAYLPGTIYMGHGKDGYVGLVRLEHDRLGIAAALSPAAVATAGGLPSACEAILRGAGLPPVAGLAGVAWRATPGLSRRPSRLGDARFLALGDAAGYVEPVTGEGVAWALEAAWDLAPLAERAVVNWDGRLVEEWEAACRLRMGSRQRVCRILTGLLRRPGVVRLLTALWERRLLSPQPLIGVINRLELPPREQAITGC